MLEKFKNCKDLIMKHTSILTIVLIAISLIVGSCGTSSLSVQILVPAEITVPSNLKKIVVINRSLPAKEARVNNIVEGVLTGEGIQVDREASYKCLDGMANVIVNSPRYEIVVPQNLDLRGTGTSVFPEPLEWKTVAEICKENGADALVALETFDSNSGLRYESQEKTKTVNNQTIKYIEHMALMDIDIEAGWRIYDPAKKEIIDQNKFIDGQGWKGVGENKDNAFKNLPAKRACISDAGYYAGQQYGYRISPVWVWVPRSYYSRGHDDFKDAKYKARAKEWDRFAEICQRHVADADMKIAGRACYNMALVNEIQGNLETALEWATKAYSDFHLKNARDYINNLKDRIYDQQKLEKQLE
ncbi:MAG TPA: hypothetical protein DDX39_09035 [Bacteroidales bacterium]|nr:MAG: hypothetical protein A2265_09650 [Bacteroidetes bacterium RIFOXYA12_FULL_33_9]HBF88772.1 hypothetical protein [Bacteroidales bacterium]